MEEPMKVQQSINILDLPWHFLDNVVKCVGEKSRRNLSLVCMQFHEIVSRKKTYHLRIDDNNINEMAILATKRKVISMQISLDFCQREKLQQVAEILKLHGGNIEKLKVNALGHFGFMSDYDSRQIIKIFKFVPKLKKLELSGVLWEFESLSNVAPMLDSVETFSICCDRGVAPDWVGLIFMPNTIKSLTIAEPSRNFRKFMDMQQNIKDLTMHAFFVDNSDFVNLKLRSVTFPTHRYDEIANEDQEYIRDLFHEFLAQHPELHEINSGVIKSVEVPFLPETIRLIAEMANLETLQLLVDPQNINELHHLSNLPKIKKIAFHLDFEDDQDSLIIISSIRLTTLENVSFIDHYHKFFNNILIIDNMALNWPNLKELKVDNADENGIDFLNAFLDKLVRLETLIINDALVQRNFIFHNTRTCYVNLKNIQICRSSHSISSLTCFLECTPNLEGFHLQHAFTLYNPQILSNFLKLDKLKKVNIRFDLESRFIQGTREDVDLLLELYRRLEDVEIIFKGHPFSDELLALLVTRYSISNTLYTNDLKLSSYV